MDTLPSPDSLAGFRSGAPITFGDLGAVLAPLFFAPGDWLLWSLATYAAPAATFLELSVADYGGVFSGFVSALAWLVLLIVASVAYQALRDLDDALTFGIVRAYAEARRRARVASNRIRFGMREYSKRRAGKRRRIEPTLELSEEIDLDSAALRVLRAHAELPDGHALTVADLAARLGMPRGDARRTVDRLTRLNLLASGAEAADANAFTLAPAGLAFLLFRRASPGRQPAGGPPVEDVVDQKAPYITSLPRRPGAARTAGAGAMPPFASSALPSAQK